MLQKIFPVSLALGQFLSRVGKIGYCDVGMKVVSMGRGMGAKQMAKRLSFSLRIAADVNTLDRALRREPESEAIVARLIPDKLRVRESFAGR
jgi:hypothetical protein